MGIFDSSIVDSITTALDNLAENQANAIVEGFERAAHIIANKLQEIDKEKNNENVYDPPP